MSVVLLVPLGVFNMDTYYVAYEMQFVTQCALYNYILNKTP